MTKKEKLEIKKLELEIRKLEMETMETTEPYYPPIPERVWLLIWFLFVVLPTLFIMYTVLF